ncbi:MAG: hypothetical protein ACXVY3_09580 [Gaiellaceae bacterium]
MSRYRLMLAFWVVLAAAGYMLYLAGAEVFWMIRDSRYVNVIMSGAIVMSLLLCGLLALVARRIRRRMDRFAKPS